MMLDYEYEYNVGMRDAENDIQRRGTYYARELLHGQDMDDPYVKGYAAFLFDYIDMYGEWGEEWEKAIAEEYGN